MALERNEDGAFRLSRIGRRAQTLSLLSCACELLIVCWILSAGSLILLAAEPGAVEGTSSPAPGSTPAQGESPAAGTTSATAPNPAAGSPNAPGAAPALPLPAATATVNAKCPVLTDEDADPAISADYQGRKIYFCCPKCRRQFLENPGRYLVNLPQLAQATGAVAGGSEGKAGTAPDASTAMPPGSRSIASSNASSAMPPGSQSAASSGASSAESPGSPPPAQPATPMRLLRFLGRFHPVIVHFPIALILAAAGAELLGWMSRSRRLLEAARLALAFGSLSAVAAAALGWAAWLFAKLPGELAPVLSTHRWLGTASALLSLLAVAVGATGGDWESPRRRLLYRLLVLACALLVGATGHYGGTLVFGTDYYVW